MRLMSSRRAFHHDWNVRGRTNIYLGTTRPGRGKKLKISPENTAIAAARAAVHQSKPP
jgi:hypothetical protein